MMLAGFSRYFLLLSLLTGCLASPALAEDIVVIVNRKNPHVLDKQQLSKIYLGKTGEWADGTVIHVLGYNEDNPLHDRFYIELLGKTPVLVKTIWAQNIFSGKCLPPKTVANDMMMKNIISNDIHAIGYINASSVDDSVRIVYPQ